MAQPPLKLALTPMSLLSSASEIKAFTHIIWKKTQTNTKWNDYSLSQWSQSIPLPHWSSAWPT